MIIEQSIFYSYASPFSILQNNDENRIKKCNSIILYYGSRKLSLLPFKMFRVCLNLHLDITGEELRGSP